MTLLHNAASRLLPRFGQVAALAEVDPAMLLRLVTSTIFGVILMSRERSPYGIVSVGPSLFNAGTIDRLIRDFCGYSNLWWRGGSDRPSKSYHP